jgi:hypothetical protein
MRDRCVEDDGCTALIDIRDRASICSDCGIIGVVEKALKGAQTSDEKANNTLSLNSSPRRKRV